MRRGVAQITPAYALAFMLVCFRPMAGTVPALTSVWGANDELCRMQKETLVSGNRCRRTQNSGLESRPSAALLHAGRVAVGSPLVAWVPGLETTRQGGRLAFGSLPTIRVLLAAGYKRLGLPIRRRLVRTAPGLVGAVVAMHCFVVVGHQGGTER